MRLHAEARHSQRAYLVGCSHTTKAGHGQKKKREEEKEMGLVICHVTR